MRGIIDLISHPFVIQSTKSPAFSGALSFKRMKPEPIVVLVASMMLPKKKTEVRDLC